MASSPGAREAFSTDPRFLRKTRPQRHGGVPRSDRARASAPPRLAGTCASTPGPSTGQTATGQATLACDGHTRRAAKAVCACEGGAGHRREADVVGALLLSKAVARHHTQSCLLQQRERIKGVGLLHTRVKTASAAPGNQGNQHRSVRQSALKRKAINTQAPTLRGGDRQKEREYVCL